MAGRVVDPGYGVRPPAYNNWRGAYAGYHRGWTNGYWHGYHNSPVLELGGFGPGTLAGVTAWGLGSSFYSWEDPPYANRYDSAETMAQPVVIEQTFPGGVPQSVAIPAVSYDYSRPIDTQAPAPELAVADPAVAKFDEGLRRLQDRRLRQGPPAHRRGHPDASQRCDAP